MLIIPVSLISPPSHLSYSRRKLKMGWRGSAIPRTTRLDVYLSNRFVTCTRWVKGSSKSVECEGFAPPLHGTRHPTTIALPWSPTLIMHSNGTYDWSYELYPLIRQCGCHFHAFSCLYDPVCHDIRPPSIPSGASPTFARPQFL